MLMSALESKRTQNNEDSLSRPTERTHSPTVRPNSENLKKVSTGDPANKGLFNNTAMTAPTADLPPKPQASALKSTSHPTNSLVIESQSTKITNMSSNITIKAPSAKGSEEHCSKADATSNYSRTIPNDQDQDMITIESTEELQGVNKELTELIKELVREAADTSALEAQKTAIKRKLEQRTAEFEKSKPQHDRFPATRDAQVFAKQEAEQELRAYSDKFRHKEASLHIKAKEAAKIIAPLILVCGRGNSEDQGSLEERCTALENACLGFQNLLEEHKQSLDEHKQFLVEQRKINQELENKQNALQKEYHNAKNSWEEHLKTIQPTVDQVLSLSQKCGEISQVTGGLTQVVEGQKKTVEVALQQERIRLKEVLEKITKTSQASENLEQSISTVKQDILKIKQDATRSSSTTAEQVQKINHIQEDIKALDQKVAKVEQKSDSFENHTNNRMFDLDKSMLNYANSITGIMQHQKDHSNVMRNAESRLKIIEEHRPQTSINVNGVENDAQKLAVSTKDFEDLNRQVKLLVKAPPSDSSLREKVDLLQAQFANISETIHKTSSSTMDVKRDSKLDSSLKAICSRVDKVEKRTDDLESQTKAQEFDKRLGIIEAKSSPSNIPSLQIRGLADVRNRLASLENKTSDDPDLSGLASLNTRLEQVEMEVELVQELQKSASITMGETITECITTSLDEIRAEFRSGPTTEIQTCVSELAKKITSAETSLLKLDKLYESLKDSSTQDVEKLNKKLANATSGLTVAAADSIEKAIKGLHTRGELPPPDLEKRILGQFHQFQASITNTIASYEQAIGNIQLRMDNLSTNELYQAIVQTIADSPVRINDASLNNLQLSVQGIETRVGQLGSTIDTLKNVSDTKDKFDPEIAKHVEYLRKVLDGLAKDIINLEKRIKKTEDTLVTQEKASASDKETIADSFVTFQETVIPNTVGKSVTEHVTKALGPIIKRVDGIAQMQVESFRKSPSSLPTTSRAASTSRRAPSSSERRLQAEALKSNVSRDRTRQASNASVASDTFADNEIGNKKRKVLEGHPSNNSNGLRTRGTHSPPAKKQRQRNQTPEDGSDGFDLEDDEISAPAVSDIE
jgi:DNA repair exonuclease SbcCD ATPase subunit